jgi:hypothetical protein
MKLNFIIKIFLSSIIFSNIFLTRIFAQTSTPEVSPVSYSTTIIEDNTTNLNDKVIDESTYEFQGEIKKITDTRLSIESDDDVLKEVMITDDVSIKRNNKDAEFQDLQIGDQVTLLIKNTNNELISIDAISQSTLNAISVGGLVLLIIILLALAIFVSKIRESTKSAKLPRSNDELR